MPSVSVVIPTYNRAEFLLCAINTVLNQTLNDYEIIIIDDGSTDDTKVKISQLVENGTLRYFYQPNRGVSASRNLGIKHARGDYIAFLDSDDLWKPDHLLRLYSALKQHSDVKIAFSNFNFEGAKEHANRANQGFSDNIHNMLHHHFDDIKDDLWLSKDSLFTALIELGFMFRIQGSMVERQFLIKHKILFNEHIKYTEEAPFVTYVSLFSRFIFINYRSLIVRLHDENIDEHKYEKCIIQSLEHRIQFLKDLNKPDTNSEEKRIIKKAILNLSEELLFLKIKTTNTFSILSESLHLFWNNPSSKSAKCVMKVLLYKSFNVPNKEQVP